MRSRIIGILAIAVLLQLFAAVLLSKPSNTSLLRKVADIPLPGAAVRFDYQSLDTSHGRLYIAHMNANQLVVFDVKKRAVVANLDGFAARTPSPKFRTRSAPAVLCGWSMHESGC